MKKWWLIGGSVFTIIVFLLIMGTAVFLKNPITGNDDVLKHVQLVQKTVKTEEWQQANNEWKEATQAWEKVKNRIQFSVERDFIEDIDDELATIKGAIVAKNIDRAIIASERIKIIWDELGR